ncbi:MAG: four helix bundle protein [Nitrospirota bacterium]
MFKFEKLNVWQKSLEAFEKVASVSDKIPIRYQSSIGDQIRRSCLSISANISEATGRSNIKEQKYHYSVAKGSIYETASLLYIMKNRKYLDKDTFEGLYAELDEIAMMLHGLIEK